MKVFAFLLVLFLTLPLQHSQAASKLVSLSSHWRKTLVSVVTTATLLFSPPVSAQQPDPEQVLHNPAQLAKDMGYQEVAEGEYTEIFYMVLDHADIRRDSHVIYLGQDKQRRALFLALRINTTVLPIKNSDSLIGIADVWLFNANGHILSQVKAEELHVFIRPDNEVMRLHDITLLAMRGLKMEEYTGAQLASHFPVDTPLMAVSYHLNLLEEDGWWVDDFINALLQKKNCRANIYQPQKWTAFGDCDTEEFAAAITAPILTSVEGKSGKLVGFGLIESEIVALPPQVKAYLDSQLAIEPMGKLSLTWGKLKDIIE